MRSEGGKVAAFSAALCAPRRAALATVAAIAAIGGAVLPAAARAEGWPERSPPGHP